MFIKCWCFFFLPTVFHSCIFTGIYVYLSSSFVHHYITGYWFLFIYLDLLNFRQSYLLNSISTNFFSIKISTYVFTLYSESLYSWSTYSHYHVFINMQSWFHILEKKLMYLKPRNPVKVGENYVFIFYPSSAEIWCWWLHLIYIISVYIWYLRFKKCRIIFADDYYLVKHDCWIELSLVHFDWIKLLNFVWLIRKVYNFDWLL